MWANASKRCSSCRDTLPLGDFAGRTASREDRERHLSSTYGITSDDVSALLGQQDRRCAICLVAEAIHIGHDHVDGRIHPAVVAIVYPSPHQASVPPARFAPRRPPLDIGELRQLASQG